MLGDLPKKAVGAAFLTFLVVGVVSVSDHAQSSLPVVPGGEGFGMTTRAAYGCGADPTVLRVTNLNDSGAGSLRAALVASSPRVVIFETSGTITLASDITITAPCLTIAGQTAPSPGIQIKGFGLIIRTHDVLMQHLRIRPGDGGPLQSNTAGHDGAIAYAGAYNVVFDHNSLSWSQGKATQAYSVAGGAGVTWWRNIISESLYKGKNVTFEASQPSSLGLLMNQMDVGQNANFSLIGNLFAHNSDRNPEATGPVSVHFINNVVYDWGKDKDNNYQWATFFYLGTGPSLAAIAGNKYIAGPPPSPWTPLIAVGVWNPASGSKIYVNDNAIDSSRQAVTPYATYGGDWRVSASPMSLSGITILPSSSVESFVLSNAGARALDRDAVDRRIVDEVTNRTGTVISSQDQVGGWPVLATNTRSLTVPSNPNAVTSAGYTNLEVWLQGYAATVEGGTNSPPPPATNTAPAPPTGVRIVAN